METVLRRANTEGERYNITFMLLRTESCDTRAPARPRRRVRRTLALAEYAVRLTGAHNRGNTHHHGVGFMPYSIHRVASILHWYSYTTLIYKIVKDRGGIVFTMLSRP